LFHNYKERKLTGYESRKPFVVDEEVIRPYGCDETIYTRKIKDRAC
jgi:hypothetical protein